MALNDSIVQLMLGRGNVLADEARERIAAQELERQNKHAAWKGTLRVLAQVAPLFIPGAGLVPAIGRFGAGLAGRYIPGMSPNPMDALTGFGYGDSDPEFLDPNQYPNILRRRG